MQASDLDLGPVIEFTWRTTLEAGIMKLIFHTLAKSIHISHSQGGWCVPRTDGRRQRRQRKSYGYTVFFWQFAFLTVSICNGGR